MQTLEGYNKTNILINLNCLMFDTYSLINTYHNLTSLLINLLISSSFSKNISAQSFPQLKIRCIVSMGCGNQNFKPLPWKLVSHDVFFEVSPRECYLRFCSPLRILTLQKVAILRTKTPLLYRLVHPSIGGSKDFVASRFSVWNSRLSANPSAPWKLLISKNFLTLLGTHEPQDIG